MKNKKQQKDFNVKYTMNLVKYNEKLNNLVSERRRF